MASAATAGVATAAPQAGAAPARPESTEEHEHAGNSGATTGAKVLPPRPTPPPRPTFTRPAPGSSEGGPGNTAAMAAPLVAGRERRLPPPRYLVPIVLGLIVLGVGAALGVIALTNNGTSSSSHTAASGNGTRLSSSASS